MPKFLEVEKETIFKKSWIKVPRIPLKGEYPSQNSSEGGELKKVTPTLGGCEFLLFSIIFKE